MSRTVDREANGAKPSPPTSKKILEMMKEATGASEEDICTMLQLCGGDANDATEKLLESRCSSDSSPRLACLGLD